ncbi:MAG TPA: ATP-binding protein [Saprospiraceae bacterium]|nr:ATP-binding protein [Saprospiraceae bacterium]HMQ82706.1 ATP-binding protein [Saprospiraceae bacterium]
MKFVNREKELNLLARVGQASLIRSKMTILAGRRRIGKTRLIVESQKESRCLYFFVARKEERLLCEEFVGLMREVLGMNIFGEIHKFKDVFALLMDFAERGAITLVIDEFQEFFRINPAIYSEMQDIWDRKKEHTRMHLILCGSIFSMMKKIFEDSREPLFGRADERLYVKPFSVETLQSTLLEYAPNHTAEDLLRLYMLTGGVPKYVELLVDRMAFSADAMLDEVLRENSLFLDEGKNVLIEEFGKEYATYFSILSLLASSKTSRGEIESVLQKDVGGYLARLENEYQVIKKVIPILAKPGTRSIKYEIEDNFLHFWFRFIYKNKATVEIGNFTYLRKLIERDGLTYSGRFLEKYFREKLALSGEWSEVGTYWESGFSNEIDIVAINRLERKVLFAEVKRNPSQYSKAALEQKTYQLQRTFAGFDLMYRGFSMADM